MHDDHFHFIVLDLAQGLFQSLDGALHVGLHHDVQVFQFAFLDPVEDIVQGDLGFLLFFFLGLGHPLFSHTPGNVFVTGIHDVPGLGHIIQAQDFHRGGRQRLFHLFTPVVHHGTDLAVAGTDQDGVPDVQGAPVDQHRSHRASALIQLGFDDGTVGRQFRVGFQFQHIGYQQDHFQQVTDTGLLTGRNRHHDGVATPGFRNQTMFRQLLHDEVRVGPFLIDFVDGHDDGHLGGFGMVDGFNGLGHDAIIGSHHQYGNICHLGTTGTHGRKGFMPRSIQENDGPALADHPVCTDVLGDTAGFPCRHVGLPDGIQQRSLAVVHVTHDGHHRRTGYPQCRVIFHFRHFRGICFRRRFLDFTVEVHAHQFGCFVVDFLVDGHHLAQHEQFFDDFVHVTAQQPGKILHADAFAHFDAGGSHHFGLFGRCSISVVVVLVFVILHHMIGTAGRTVFPGSVRALDLLPFFLMVVVVVPLAHILAGMGTVHIHSSRRPV